MKIINFFTSILLLISNSSYVNNKILKMTPTIMWSNSEVTKSIINFNEVLGNAIKTVYFLRTH